VFQEPVDKLAPPCLEVCADSKNKYALALVGRSDFRRAEYSCRDRVAHSLQLAEDMEQNGSALGVCPRVSCELGADDSFHIFEENKGRSAQFSESSEDVGEQVSGVIVSFAGSSGAEGLTREAT